MGIGLRIKALRENKGLTQEELARLLNTKRQTISKYEKEVVTNIPSDRLQELAKVLDTTPEYILGWGDSSAIGEKIRRLRIQKGWTQEKLAERAGYTDRSSVAKIEKGQVDLSQKKIAAFAEALNVAPTALMGLDQPENNNSKNANLGEMVYQLRQRAGLTQEELAFKVGYKTKSAINKIEQGTRDIPQKKIVAFANALNVAPAALMGWEQAESESSESVSICKETAPKLYKIIKLMNKLTPEQLDAVMRLLESMLG